MTIANTDSFALAVVQSSDPKLTVEEKLSLFTSKQETKQKNITNNILIRE